MYELPQIENVVKVTINRAVVEGRGKPKLEMGGAETKKAADDDSEGDSANAA
jgi:ATP-dependent protease Clp ATPase subunit